jgi:hypothetical protein
MFGFILRETRLWRILTLTISLFFFPFSSPFTVGETIVSVAVGIDFKQNPFHCFELKPRLTHSLRRLLSDL